MTSAVDRLLPHLDKLRKTGPSSWSARCPAHDDKGPSLAIRETDDGRVLLHCFAGCGVHNVVASIGLELSDLFPPKPSTPGAGAVRERRPWRAADLVRLASYEASVIVLLVNELATAGDLEAADQDRLVEAAARLCDISNHVETGV